MTVIVASFSAINNALPPGVLEISTVLRSHATLTRRSLLLINGAVVVLSEGGGLIFAEVDWSDEIIGPQIDAPNL